MQAFEYANPTTKEEAVRLLATQWGEAEILAGGTDLLSLMKDHVSTPRRVVSLQAIKELRGIEFKPATGLRLGAMTTLSELIESAEVRREYPALVEAAEGVRSPQILNMGTVGGDLCQRPRCWYFRAGYGLLARDDGKALVPEGENQYHAILGNSGPAYFVNPSSLAPALIALGAKVRVFGPQGTREVRLGQVLPHSRQRRRARIRPEGQRNPHRYPCASHQGNEDGDLRSSPAGSPGLSVGGRGGCAEVGGQDSEIRARRAGPCGPGTLARAGSRSGARREDDQRGGGR